MVSSAGPLLNTRRRPWKHTYFNPSKMWDELSIYKTYNGPSWHGPSFASWAELAWAEFYVGRLGMGRVGFGPSCPAPIYTMVHPKLIYSTQREDSIGPSAYNKVNKKSVITNYRHHDQSGTLMHRLVCAIVVHWKQNPIFSKLVIDSDWILWKPRPTSVSTLSYHLYILFRRLDMKTSFVLLFHLSKNCRWPGFGAQLIGPIQLHAKRQNSSICKFFQDIAWTFFCLWVARSVIHLSIKWKDNLPW